MQRSLFGRVLLLDLGFPIHLSRTTGFNLIVRLSGGIAMSLALEIDIQPQPIRKGMCKLKQLIKL